MNKKLVGLMAAALTGSLSLNAGSVQDTLTQLEIEDAQFFVYIDLEDDIGEVGDLVTRLYNAYLATNPNIMPVPVDAARLLEHLGLAQIKEYVIASNDPVKGLGILNQGYISYSDAPSGLGILFGDANEPFISPGMVPAEMDFVLEFQFNVPAILDTVRKIATDVMGPMGESMVMGQLSQPITPSGMTGLSIIEQLDTRLILAFDIDSLDLNFDMEEPDAFIQSLLAMDFMLMIDKVGPLVEELSPMLNQMGLSPVIDDEFGAWSFPIPIPMGDVPVQLFFSKVPGSDALVISLKTGMREKLLNPTSTLADVEEFKVRAKELPSEGTALYFTSSSMSRLGMLQLELGFQTSLPPEFLPMSSIVTEFFERFVGPTVSVGFWDGMDGRSKSWAPASIKTSIATTLLAIPAAIAIPALAKQQDAARVQMIESNLRMILSAGQQYLLESGETEVAYGQLIDEGYFNPIVPVAGEDYGLIIITPETEFISVTTAEGDEITVEF